MTYSSIQRSMDSAPINGTFILLGGPSGYSTTPLRFEVCKFDPEFRPRQPWVDYAGDSFTDGGEAPTCWIPLPLNDKDLVLISNMGWHFKDETENLHGPYENAREAHTALEYYVLHLNLGPCPQPRS